MKYLPNILTWFRLLSAPFLITLFVLAADAWRDIAAAALFIIVGVTDLLDGYLARRYNAVTRFGEFLDPVADKVIVITALLLLLDAGRAELLAVAIITCREIYTLGLREWMAKIGKSVVTVSSLAGKLKTAVQMTAVALLLLNRDVFDLPLIQIGGALLWAAAALGVYSLLRYKIAAFRELAN